MSKKTVLNKLQYINKNNYCRTKRSAMDRVYGARPGVDDLEDDFEYIPRRPLNQSQISPSRQFNQSQYSPESSPRLQSQEPVEDYKPRSRYADLTASR